MQMCNYRTISVDTFDTFSVAPNNVILATSEMIQEVLHEMIKSVKCIISTHKCCSLHLFDL